MPNLNTGSQEVHLLAPSSFNRLRRKTIDFSLFSVLACLFKSLCLDHIPLVHRWLGYLAIKRINDILYCLRDRNALRERLIYPLIPMGMRGAKHLGANLRKRTHLHKTC